MSEQPRHVSILGSWNCGIQERSRGCVCISCETVTEFQHAAVALHVIPDPMMGT